MPPKPNAKPTADAARQRILAAMAAQCPEADFQPLMTLYLTDNTPAEFLKTFDENRGQTVDVNVATLAAQSNGTLANAPTRVVTVAVPP